MLADFTAVSDALNCAVAVQKELKQRNEPLPQEKRVQFRIGLNLCEVIVDRGEVYGNGVNVAARLETLAEPSGICISGAARDAIGNKLLLAYEFLGEHIVKNIDAPLRAYRVNFSGELFLAAKPLAPGVQPGLAKTTRLRWLTAAAAFALIVAGTWWARSRPWSAAPTALTAPATPGAGTAAMSATTNPVQAAKANRIAVLPFANLSADKDNEYFSDGITEEMISRLSRVSGLEVIARTSAMSYKGTTKKIAEIAKELNVGSVLEGSVRREGNTVRITAQLIRADNEAHLWAEDFEQDLKNVLGIQKSIAERVAREMSAKLGTPVGAAVEQRGTQNTEAYNALLKARFHANKSTLDGLQKGIEYFQEAIRLDPSFALAYVGLADAYEQLPLQDDAYSKEVYPKARTAAQRAIELEPDLPEAHAALAVVRTFYDYDWSGGESAFQRALKLNPNSSASLWWYAWYQIFLRNIPLHVVWHAHARDPKGTFRRVAQAQTATQLSGAQGTATGRRCSQSAGVKGIIAETGGGGLRARRSRSPAYHLRFLTKRRRLLNERDHGRQVSRRSQWFARRSVCRRRADQDPRIVGPRSDL